MSFQLTQSILRSAIGMNIGEGVTTGTFTNAPGTGTQAIDANRWDDDNLWNNGWIQDISLAISNGVGARWGIARINTWTLGTNSWGLYGGLASPGGVATDPYEVHVKLSFDELTNAINNGIGLCGKWLRNQVRDETFSMVANQYQYAPNYNSGVPNAFFPGEVVRIDWEYWTGQGTREWIELKDWYYLDDETIQFPTWIVDAFAPNPIRFTGYGPVSGRILNPNPTLVIATFDDEFAANMLIWAATAAAWNILGSKLQANEQSAAKQNEQNALQQFQASRSTWTRGRAQTGRTRTPMSVGGWKGT